MYKYRIFNLKHNFYLCWDINYHKIELLIVKLVNIIIIRLILRSVKYYNSSLLTSYGCGCDIIAPLDCTVYELYNI